MARKVTITLSDDLNPEYEADETLSFAVDGIEYEIDLSSSNAEKFREVVGPYAAAARKVGGRSKRGRPASRRTSVDREQSKAIREWANNNGYTVSTRGRISQDIVDAYNNA